MLTNESGYLNKFDQLQDGGDASSLSLSNNLKLL